MRDVDGATLVYVYNPLRKRVFSRRVTVGAPFEREIEIVSGLTPQDEVVIGGQQLVRDGALAALTTVSDSMTVGGEVK
jgi:multidrug efflux pump subunit AcrA (membrane-fusion protein)